MRDATIIPNTCRMTSLLTPAVEDDSIRPPSLKLGAGVGPDDTAVGGCVTGLRVGCFELGAAVGKTDGFEDGVAVLGTAVGKDEGLDEGGEDGACVGNIVGTPLGFTVGETVGLFVSPVVVGGAVDGRLLGFEVVG